MSKKGEIYRCSVCGAVVEVLNSGGTLYCCGQPMGKMAENTSDASGEKHLPVVESVAGGYEVSVGRVHHPMTPEHYIQWIEMVTACGVQRCYLHPGSQPEVFFRTEEHPVEFRAYCNLHGLWKFSC